MSKSFGYSILSVIYSATSGAIESFIACDLVLNEHTGFYNGTGKTRLVSFNDYLYDVCKQAPRCNVPIFPSRCTISIINAGVTACNLLMRMPDGSITRIPDTTACSHAFRISELTYLVYGALGIGHEISVEKYKYLTREKGINFSNSESAAGVSIPLVYVNLSLPAVSESFADLKMADPDSLSIRKKGDGTVIARYRPSTDLKLLVLPDIAPSTSITLSKEDSAVSFGDYVLGYITLRLQGNAKVVLPRKYVSYVDITTVADPAQRYDRNRVELITPGYCTILKIERCALNLSFENARLNTALLIMDYSMDSFAANIRELNTNIAIFKYATSQLNVESLNIRQLCYTDIDIHVPIETQDVNSDILVAPRTFVSTQLSLSKERYFHTFKGNITAEYVSISCLFYTHIGVPDRNTGELHIIGLRCNNCDLCLCCDLNALFVFDNCSIRTLRISAPHTDSCILRLNNSVIGNIEQSQST